jgi:Tfp pilus assembly protein PilV
LEQSLSAIFHKIYLPKFQLYVYSKAKAIKVGKGHRDMKQSGRQSGFGTIVVLLAILVVALLALTTVVIYQHHKTNSTKSNVSTNTTQITTKPKNTTTTEPSSNPAPTNQNANTYTISELYAKITLPSGLTPSDLKYSISTSTGVPVADFTTASLEQADGTSSCSAGQAPIGVIWRTTQNPASGSVIVKQIGQYYYAFEKPQGSCTGNLNAGKLEQSQTALLQQAFETITATN